MNYKSIESTADYQSILDNEGTGLFYFSHNSCNVGESVKEKVLDLVGDSFPLLDCYFVDVERASELAGQNSIFVYPTILVFFEGKEFYRFSRNISIGEIKEKIERPYHMIMG